MSTNKEQVQQAMAALAPKLAQVTSDVLFGDIWERDGLSRRDRSLVTVAALVALYRLEQLPFHLERALENGVTRDELAEVITHLAFYAGWPTAASAVQLLHQACAGKPA
ncbi:carboxymuconolactone decarboxylase family protein [Massilia solisilvae]|uniref:Carboxymuconolactone decarboxylase family protein n=1 Tax=Massilia solisilvae TaxID=1811225 RepID=A0ABT2BH06_9BURK|nr:carboxymuconolactone decarboxylase family protein [Massilia solisilvae]MCS0607796.1 carboxymuconolactone decarboxylase family protein [Massilia solisilvae]